MAQVEAVPALRGGRHHPAGSDVRRLVEVPKDDAVLPLHRRIDQQRYLRAPFWHLRRKVVIDGPAAREPLLENLSVAFLQAGDKVLKRRQAKRGEQLDTLFLVLHLRKVERDV